MTRLVSTHAHVETAAFGCLAWAKPGEIRTRISKR
jgi:hypothetical protein